MLNYFPRLLPLALLIAFLAACGTPATNSPAYRVSVKEPDCLMTNGVPNRHYMPATVTNNGSETASNLKFTAEYRTSNGRVAGTGAAVVPSLAPGATTRLNVSGPVLVTGGSQYLVVTQCVLTSTLDGKTYIVKYNRVLEPRVPVQ